MKRVPLKRTTPLRPKGPMRRSAKRGQRKPMKPGFSDQVKAAVRSRSRGVCEACGGLICRRRASHFHHRQLRRHGDHSEANCLHVSDVCHDQIHHMGDGAYLLGLLVQSFKDPAEVPVRRLHMDG